MPINTVIRERRKALGLTQEQVAEQLGVTAPAVNKWEKGSTYPDITLVAALARLLKVDLNTLLCFRETLTQQEINNYMEEVARKIGKNGIEAGFSLAESRIKEYPNCGALIEGMATLLDGSIIMADLSGEEKGGYQERLRALYEQAMHCDDEDVRRRAGYMTASKYLHSKEYEKVQEIIDQLPETDLIDKNMLQADLWKEQGKYAEALKLVEKMVLQQNVGVMGNFWRMIDLELAMGNEENARRLAQKAQEAAKTYDMWGYNGLVGFHTLALKQQNVEESLKILDQMLEQTYLPWKMNESVLYHVLYQDYQEAAANVTMAEKILPPLLAELEGSPEYDFLRPHEEFQKLIGRYRRRLGCCEQSEQ